jgi:ABC-type multidrug transport system ATPase subunit
VLVATHLLGEWEGRVDRCLLIADGRCAGELAPDRLRDAFFVRDARVVDEPRAMAACA